jgi:hypothetical protein
MWQPIGEESDRLPGRQRDRYTRIGDIRTKAKKTRDRLDRESLLPAKGGARIKITIPKRLNSPIVSIFIAAVFDFGKVDAIGHLPILVAMAAMFVHGPTQLQVWLHDKADSAFRLGHTAGSAFVMTVFLFLAVYYGLQHAEYGHNPQDKIAAFPAPGHHL